MVDLAWDAVLRGLFRPVDIAIPFAGERRNPRADGGENECRNERCNDYLSIKMFDTAYGYQDAKETEATDGKAGKYGKSFSLGVIPPPIELLRHKHTDGRRRDERGDAVDRGAAWKRKTRAHHRFD